MASTNNGENSNNNILSFLKDKIDWLEFLKKSMNDQASFYPQSGPFDIELPRKGREGALQWTVKLSGFVLKATAPSPNESDTMQIFEEMRQFVRRNAFQNNVFAALQMVNDDESQKGYAAFLFLFHTKMALIEIIHGTKKGKTRVKLQILWYKYDALEYKTIDERICQHFYVQEYWWNKERDQKKIFSELDLVLRDHLQKCIKKLSEQNQILAGVMSSDKHELGLSKLGASCQCCGLRILGHNM
jgi:hypothetical protein